MTPQHAYYYNASREIMDTAKRLRKIMTPAEKLLWQELKGNKINGRHFRRQHPIYRYIADFYCHKEKLVIEVDGLYHNNPEQHYDDNNRDATMKEVTPPAPPRGGEVDSQGKSKFQPYPGDEFKPTKSPLGGI